MASVPGFEEQVVIQIDRQTEGQAKATAAELGRPPGTEDITEAREIAEWLRDDQKIDVDALLAQKVPIEEITRAKHPNRVRLIEMHSPLWEERCKYSERLWKLVQKYQAENGPEPTDEELAAAAAPVEAAAPMAPEPVMSESPVPPMIAPPPTQAAPAPAPVEPAPYGVSYG